MRRIAHLIGIHPDKAGLYTGTETNQIVDGPGIAFAAKSIFYYRCGIAQKFSSPADLHFDQQGLAFVDAHAPRLTHRLTAPRLGQAPFIHRMAGFVQNPHQSRGKVIFIVTGGNPDVIRNPAAEWVQADIQTPMLEIKAQRLHQPDTKLALFVDCKRSLGTDRWRIECLAFDYLSHKTREKILQVLKHRVYVAAATARLIFVQKRVVGLKPQLFCLGLGRLADDPNETVESGQHGTEIAVQSGLAPNCLASHPGPAKTEDQLFIKSIGVVPAPPHLADIGRLPPIQGAVGFRRIKKLADLGGGNYRMAYRLESAKLILSCPGPAARHHRRPVPVQHRGSVRNIGQTGKP